MLSDASGPQSIGSVPGFNIQAFSRRDVQETKQDRLGYTHVPWARGFLIQ